MHAFSFRQVDVFTARPGYGNALAVVHNAAGLSDAEMARFANWTNLSETVFLLPAGPGADYRLRIFTPAAELPFAGHPTLGACHAWLEAGGVPRGSEIVQDCAAGLIRIRRDGPRLAFAAPPLAQSGVSATERAQIATILGIAATEILAARHLSALAPRWTGVLLRDRETVLALRPDFRAMHAANLEIGAIAPWPGGGADFEVRGFAPELGVGEDPVTGSLNAGLARWLIPAGLAPEAYTVSQGTVLGREGRIHVARDGADFWIGGESVTVITGAARL
jgi:PhzF family phenazine biosynthesis protein